MGRFQTFHPAAIGADEADRNAALRVFSVCDLARDADSRLRRVSCLDKTRYDRPRIQQGSRRLTACDRDNRWPYLIGFRSTPRFLRTSTRSAPAGLDKAIRHTGPIQTEALQKSICFLSALSSDRPRSLPRAAAPIHIHSTYTYPSKEIISVIIIEAVAIGMLRKTDVIKNHGREP